MLLLYLLWKQPLSVVLKPGLPHVMLSKRFAQTCPAQTTRNLVDNTDSGLPVIVMQMLMDSEVLWLAWCGLISLLYSPQRAQSAFSLSPLLIAECWVVFFCLAGLADRQAQQPGNHGLNGRWCRTGWMLHFLIFLAYSLTQKKSCCNMAAFAPLSLPLILAQSGSCVKRFM